MDTLNKLPWSGVLVTSIFPLYESTSFFTMERPSPLPVIFLVFSFLILTKSWNSFSISCCVIPIPVSATEMPTRSPSSRILQVTEPPSLLYLIALDIRLLNMISTSFGSVCTMMLPGLFRVTLTSFWME